MRLADGTGKSQGRPPSLSPGSVTLSRALLLPGLLCSIWICGCRDKSPGACYDKECGVWDGVDCGSCFGPTDFCNNEGLCEDACIDQECGVWHGVDCGTCPECWSCDQGRCHPGPSAPPPCPEEFGPNGEICVNGYAHWVFDDRGGQGAFMEHRVADPSATEDSTYAVVEVYDPLPYANDPDNTPPLGVGEINPKEGTFRVLNVAVPSQGILAFVVEDIDDDASDLFALTAVPFPVVRNEHLLDVVAFGVTHNQVERWSEAAGGEAALAATGCPEPAGGGPRTLLTCGTWIAAYTVFDRPGLGLDCHRLVLNPVEGVVPEDPGGDVPTRHTFYPGIDANGQLVFDDPNRCVVWSDDQGPHEWTGRLGSVFGVYVALGEISGHCEGGTQCAEASCIWPELLGGSIQNALFVQFMPQVVCANWPPPEDTTCATSQ